MDSDLEALVAVLLVRKRRRSRRQRERRFWVHPILRNRSEYGHFASLFEELKNHEDKFFKYFRMNLTTFSELLSLLEDGLNRKDTYMRESIHPPERLAITLRYLSTGCSFGDFEFVYRCGASTARKIVRETCQLIWHHFKTIYIPEPTEDAWRTIANGFQQSCNFPNCLGAIDGKHIRIIHPKNSGSLYRNYKSYFSLVLLAACDSNYMFTFVDVGSYGKASDSTIYKESELFSKIQASSLNIPPPQEIKVMGVSRLVNYSFVGDEAFGLSEHMLRPYSGKHLDAGKRIFNYRLSRARRCIECAFGILSNKWRILHRPLNTSVDFSEEIVKACCMLHNFVRQRDGYNFHDSLHVHGLDDIATLDMPNLRSVTTRDILKDYFINEGAIPWQENVNHVHIENN